MPQIDPRFVLFCWVLVMLFLDTIYIQWVFLPVEIVVHNVLQITDNIYM